MRVKLIKINQERLAKIETAEDELFSKDYERMEKRVDVKSLKDNIMEELDEQKRNLNDQKIEIINMRKR